MTLTGQMGRASLKRAALASALILAAASSAQATTLKTITQAVNIFTSGAVTGGVPATVDVGGPTAIVPTVEFPGFAFGTYDVDVSGNSLEMTFVNDPASLGIAVYDSTTVDQYFFAFDLRIASAEVTTLTPGFAVDVELVAPGTSVTSATSFVPSLGTNFSFPNGGILISVGDGTNLNTVGTGGAFSVSFTPVPVPASLPILLAGLAGLGLIRRRAA